jgi:hypothetical protein
MPLFSGTRAAASRTLEEISRSLIWPLEPSTNAWKHAASLSSAGARPHMGRQIATAAVANHRFFDSKTTAITLGILPVQSSKIDGE